MNMPAAPAPRFRRFGKTDQVMPVEPAETPGPGKPVSNRRANRYPGNCINCGVRVGAEEGYLAKDANGKWAAEHPVCPEGNVLDNVPAERDAVHAQTVIGGKVLFDGTYTLTDAVEGQRTFRLRTQSVEDDFMPGKQIIAFLSGPDNDSDYTKFGHVLADGTLRVWNRYQDNDTLVTDARRFLAAPHGENVLPSVACYRCGRTLTVEASIHNGLGPECSRKGW